MDQVREVRDDERAEVLAIVNDAAEAYRGVIPADSWHDPYMDAAELDAEIAAGVVLSAMDHEGELVAVMGIQPVLDVDLIRHAYVVPAHQGSGLGSALLRHLTASTQRPLLVGTWAAASWAIGFYEHHGFRQVGPRRAAELLLDLLDRLGPAGRDLGGADGPPGPVTGVSRGAERCSPGR